MLGLSITLITCLPLHNLTGCHGHMTSPGGGVVEMGVAVAGRQGEWDIYLCPYLNNCWSGEVNFHPPILPVEHGCYDLTKVRPVKEDVLLCEEVRSCGGQRS